jgi:hypothetical protein
MDQCTGSTSVDRQWAEESLSSFIAASVETSRTGDVPFGHIVFDRVFPDDFYAAMLAAMPANSDYRPMSGRATENVLADGTHTRVKFELFPEYIRNLAPKKRDIWQVVGGALRSEPVKQALVRKLAPGLRRRFGSEFESVGMYPIPILTRDIPGYCIAPHADTHWKGITAQFYLPRDDSSPHIGTIFHELMSDGSAPKRAQMKFMPNSGYAFAVDTDLVHSADPVGSEVKMRDSILLTYFVDAGPLRYMRNRSKRIGNFLLNAFLQRVRR